MVYAEVLASTVRPCPPDSHTSKHSVPGNGTHSTSGPAVAVEVAGEGQEVVRIVLRIEGLPRPILVPLLEIRAFEPERAGDDVHLAVAVEVAVVGALGVELVGEAQLLEGVALGQRGRLWRAAAGLGAGARTGWAAPAWALDAAGPGWACRPCPTIRAQADQPPPPWVILSMSSLVPFLSLIGAVSWSATVAAVDVVAVNHRAVQPGLDAVVAAQQQGGVAVLRAR